MECSVLKKYILIKIIKAQAATNFKRKFMYGDELVIDDNFFLNYFTFSFRLSQSQHQITVLSLFSFLFFL